MKDRLLKLITDLNFTATKFADEIGVQRSGISHILSGRNQPSYDFFVKILTKFPDLSAEWLILGRGMMLNAKQPDIKSVTTNNPDPLKKEPDLFTTPLDQSKIKSRNQINFGKVTYVNSIQRVILLNTDGTFDLYNPASKE